MCDKTYFNKCVQFCVGNLTGEDEQGDFYKIVVIMN